MARIINSNTINESNYKYVINNGVKQLNMISTDIGVNHSSTMEMIFQVQNDSKESKNLFKKLIEFLENQKEGIISSFEFSDTKESLIIYV